MKKPLEGVRILDLSRFISGPFCTMLLADFGADVIKIEPPSGDPLRGIGIKGDFQENPIHVQLNRNKRSVVIDMKTTEGLSNFMELIKAADVLVENFRPGVMEKMGIGYNTLKRINPELIYASITGFGENGPYRDRPAFDFIIQAMSGFMSLNGSEDTGPLRTGPPLSDTISGLYTALGIMVALQQKAQTGKGDRVDVSLLDSMMSMFSFSSSAYFATGKQPSQVGNQHLVVAPYGVYQAFDGPICIAPSHPKMWAKLCVTLGLEELINDARFLTNEARLNNREELNRIINEVIGKKKREDWIDELNEVGVPCGPLNDLHSAFNDPQVQHNQMVLESNQNTEMVQMTGFPVKMKEGAASLRLPAPQIGEHNDILASIGISTLAAA